MVNELFNVWMSSTSTQNLGKYLEDIELMAAGKRPKNFPTMSELK